MLLHLIEVSIRYRWMVLIAALGVVLSGIYSAYQLPLDAIPDLTNVQVQVVTSAGSMSPIDVERYVTNPLEKELSGLPKLQELRSISRLGISLITVVFDEGTDLYWARQIVDQRLRGIAPMPNGIGQPQLGPLTTALGEVLQFEVRSETGAHSPTQLRSILEWQIAPSLKGVPGVVEVNAHGGKYLAFEIQPAPERLRALGLSLNDLVTALEDNNVSTGGGYMIAGSQQRFIQGEALLQSLDDVRKISLRSADEGSPVFMRDVAEVVEGSLLRQGVATRDGRGEVVIGMAMMLTGQNSRVVVQRVKERLDSIADTLPEGVRTEVIYDREGLIHRAIETVGRNLLEGGLFVVVVLLVFLGSFRAGLITALAIPLSMMFAVNAMHAWGIAASLMSLGAIDFGIIVDSSVIMIENCSHRLGLAPPNVSKESVIRDASIEVRRPTLFGELIIASVYVPVLMLEGSAGKLFRPMALTVLLALLGSLIVSMTVMPALATLFLKRPKLEHGHEKPSLLMRWLTAAYRPIVDGIVHRPIVAVIVALLCVGISIPMALRLGAEFMPRLEEGDMLIEAVRLPSATLEDAVPMSTAIEDIVRQNPEVRTVFCKTGRPEIANDIMGVHQTDVWVMLTPKETWREGVTRESLIERFESQLQRAIPGVRFGFTQPIEMRVDELVAGVKADVAVLIYGDDLKQIAKLG
nr:CusA/CzcA family heavy metal efflux RND transporter [Pirellula sp.]